MIVNAKELLVDLDAILDTRMGTLLCMHPDIATKAIACNYHSRLTDVWQEIGLAVNQHEYKRRYTERDADVLEKSIVTPILDAISKIANAIIVQLGKTPFYEGIELKVNIWPYEIHESAHAGLIASIAHHVPIDLKVSLVNIPLSDLTPLHIKSKYIAVCMYGFDEWLRYHGKSLETIELPDVEFLVPAIYYTGRVATDADLKETATNFRLEKATHNVHFGATELQFVSKLKLIMVDVLNFSFVV